MSGLSCFKQLEGHAVDDMKPALPIIRTKDYTIIPMYSLGVLKAVQDFYHQE